MPLITLSAATANDADTLMALALEAFGPSYQLYDRYPHGIESLSWHKEQIESGFPHAVLYESELVGGIYVEPLSDQEMKISHFFISPNHQGKKIGSTVINLIEQQYADVRKWSLISPYKDYGNHYFYEKHGYIRVGQATPFEGSEFKLYLYEKQL